MKVEEIKTIKEGVIYCLENYPPTRNSDKELILRYLLIHNLGYRIDGGIGIKYDKLNELPCFESITRCRRKIQEEGQYPATNEVTEARNTANDEMKDINKWF